MLYPLLAMSRRAPRHLYHLGQDRGDGIEALGRVANEDPQFGRRSARSEGDGRHGLAWLNHHRPKMMVFPRKSWKFCITYGDLIVDWDSAACFRFQWIDSDGIFGKLDGLKATKFWAKHG